MISILRITIVFVFMCSSLAAQEQWARTIDRFAYRMVNDSSYTLRKEASDSLMLWLDRFLLKYPDQISLLEDGQGLSMLRSDDGKLSIFSWQLYKSTGNCQYLGRIYRHDREESIELNDQSKRLSDIEFAELSANEWYGALYYDIKQVSEQQYLLFGYNAYSPSTKRKLVDVLTIDEGELHFGAPMFGNRDESKRYFQYRFILDYAAHTAPSLRFVEESQLIVFDHLIPIKSHFRHQKTMLVPDGTFSGYHLEEGYCYYEDDVSP